MDREWSRQAQISFEITIKMRRRIVRYLATKLVKAKITDMDDISFCCEVRDTLD
jgi:hypothetical protein